jgi:hypothetical protein
MDTQHFTFVFENDSIFLEPLIDFQFLKLIVESSNIIERFQIEIKTNTSANIFVLFKHFFEDFGYNQKYVNINVVRDKTDNIIIYKITPLELELLDADTIPVDFFISFTIITPHKIMVNLSLQFSEKLPGFIENMIKNIIKKTFSKIKQYIEKLTC